MTNSKHAQVLQVATVECRADTWSVGDVEEWLKKIKWVAVAAAACIHACMRMDPQRRKAMRVQVQSLTAMVPISDCTQLSLPQALPVELPGCVLRC